MTPRLHIANVALTANCTQVLTEDFFKVGHSSSLHAQVHVAMLKTLTFHCFLLTLTLLLPVTKPEVECISIDQRVRWQNQLLWPLLHLDFHVPKRSTFRSERIPSQHSTGVIGGASAEVATPWWPHWPSPRNATILQFFRTTADEN